MLKTLLRMILLCALCLLTVSGCGEDGESPDAASGSESGRAPLVSDTDIEEDLESKKWNHYVDAAADEGSVTAYAERYFEFFGRDKEPAFPDDEDWEAVLAWAEDPEGQHARLVEQTEQTASMAGRGRRSGLDNTVAEYASAIRTLLDALGAARSYYADTEYEADDFSEAGTVHTRVMDAWDALLPVIDDFDAILDAENRIRRQKELERMRAEGHVILEAALTVALEAEKALDEIERQAIADDNVEKLDGALLKPHYQRMIAALETLEKESGNARQVEKEGLKVFLVTATVERGTTLQTHLAALIDPAESNVNARKSGGGVISALYRYYNAYIGDCNTMMMARDE